MAQRAARIVATDDVLHGEPRIEGRRIGVRQIRVLVEESGLSAAEVADRFDLRVADVYAALTYYHEHPEEMRVVERRRQEAIEEDERVVESHEESLSATAEAAAVDPEELRERVAAVEFVDSDDPEDRRPEARTED